MPTTETKSTSAYQLPEVRIRLAEGPDTLYSHEQLSTPKDAAHIIGETLLKDMDREILVAVSLDTKLRPINYSIVSVGTLSESAAHPREILKSAVLSNASGLLLLHNHPSSDITPSAPDLQLTSRMREAGELMGIPLIDHIIVGGGNGTYYSMSEHDQLQSQGSSLIVGEKGSTYQVSRKEKVAALTDRLKSGVTNYLNGEKYMELLRMMGRFHRYSVNNTLLIAMQRPDASSVASYTTWKALHRQVNAGEKGIQILCPTPFKKTIENERLDPTSGLPVKDAAGNPVKDTVEHTYTGFRVGYVFDISQTSQIPGTEEIQLEPVRELLGSVPNYDDMIRAVSEIGSVPVRFQHIASAAKGYFSLSDQEIVIRPEMSELQTLKTLIHEEAHARLHNTKDIKGKNSTSDLFSREDKEMQAESIAFVVASSYGLDTSEYSFPYVGTWAGALEKLVPNLEIIRETACEMIGEIDMTLSQIQTDHIAEQAFLAEQETATSSRHISM